MCGYFSLYFVFFSFTRKVFSTVYRSVLSRHSVQMRTYDTTAPVCARVLSKCVLAEQLCIDKPTERVPFMIEAIFIVLLLCEFQVECNTHTEYFIWLFCVIFFLFRCPFYCCCHRCRCCCRHFCFTLHSFIYFFVVLFRWLVVAWCFQLNYKTCVHVYSPTDQLAKNFY